MAIQKFIFPDSYCTLRYYQIPIFSAIDRGIKRIIQCWSRQLGKDTNDFLVTVAQAMKNPGNYFYVFPTREAAFKALWEKIDRDGKPLLSCIPESKLLRKSEQKLFLKIAAGIDGKDLSTIQVVGLDYNPDSIRGITPRGIVFSEFAYQDAEVYKTILPALLQYPDAWVIYNSTPNGKNHFYDLWNRTHFGENSSAEGWFTSFHQTLHPDKEGYVSPEISGITPEQIRIMQVENGFTDEFIEQEFGCSFDIGASGSIYNNALELAKNDGRIGSYIHNKTKRVDTFWDLGLKDPTVIWFRQLNGNKEVFFDYLEVVNTDFDDIVLELKERGYRYGTHYLPHDGDQRVQQTKMTDGDMIEKLLTEFEVTGTVEVCPKLRKKNTINGLKALFGNFCFDEDKCYPGLKALYNYHYTYDKRKKTYGAEPYDDWSSHACDALGTRVAATEYMESQYEDKNPYVKLGKYKQDFDPFDY